MRVDVVVSDSPTRKTNFCQRSDGSSLSAKYHSGGLGRVGECLEPRIELAVAVASVSSTYRLCAKEKARAGRA